MNIETIKQTSRARYEHATAKMAAKENHQARLLLTAYGGIFRITPELISFLSVSQTDEFIILLDIYDTPIKVNREQLLTLAYDQYTKVMSDWYHTVNTINKQR